jgi:hypothetical protein
VIRWLGSACSLIGAAGLLAGILALSNPDGWYPDGIPLAIAGALGLLTGVAAAILGVAHRTGRASRGWIVVAIAAAAAYFFIYWSGLVLHNWSGVETLMYCEGGCPPADGYYQLLAAWITATLAHFALSFAWTKNFFRGVVLALAAIPVVNVFVFATPSTRPSTTAPRSPATAETPA